MSMYQTLHRENWSERTYTDNKALVSAVFSKMAYEHIGHAERVDGDYAQIIPCHAFQEILEHGETAHLGKDLLRSFEIFERDIIETDYSVSVILNAPNVVFVATRGTRLFYEEMIHHKPPNFMQKIIHKVKSIDLKDLLIDINARHAHYNEKDTDYCFHDGFYSVAQQILDHIEKFHALNGDKPIYFVGHSLGGALSAIMSTLPPKRNASQAYVFGTPRYCDQNVFSDLYTPYSIVNPMDVITKLPSKFSLVPYEHTKVIEPEQYGVSIPKTWLLPQHRMEVYLESMEKIVAKSMNGL